MQTTCMARPESSSDQQHPPKRLRALDSSATMDALWWEEDGVSSGDLLPGADFDLHAFTDCMDLIPSESQSPALAPHQFPYQHQLQHMHAQQQLQQPYYLQQHTQQHAQQQIFAQQQQQQIFAQQQHDAAVFNMHRPPSVQTWHDAPFAFHGFDAHQQQQQPRSQPREQHQGFPAAYFYPGATEDPSTPVSALLSREHHVHAPRPSLSPALQTQQRKRRPTSRAKHHLQQQRAKQAAKLEHPETELALARMTMLTPPPPPSAHPRRLAGAAPPAAATSAPQRPLQRARGLDINPRDFKRLIHALGAEVRQDCDGSLRVGLAANQAPLLRPVRAPLEQVQHEKTYIMSGHVPMKERRRHDVFSDMRLSGDRASFWCDQGNAHCVMDVANPLREVAADGFHINPRTIQVAHALASRVSKLLDSERPVMKCFYYSLSTRVARKRKRDADKQDDSGAASSSAAGKKEAGKKEAGKGKKRSSGTGGGVSLGLHKHVYVLCDQTIDNRHDVLPNSNVWLVRYFVKGPLDPELAPFVVSTNPTQASRSPRSSKKKELQV